MNAGTLRRGGHAETLPTRFHAGDLGLMTPDDRRVPARETVTDDVHSLTAEEMALFHLQNPQRGVHAVRFTRAHLPA